VTISSQLRYIKYFETFLISNFSQPYYNHIPKIVNILKIDNQPVNMLTNLKEDDSYFFSYNKYKINFIKIGPFPRHKALDIKFSSLIHKDIPCPNSESFFNEENGRYFFNFVRNFL
jgi:hypothetical protein